MHITRQTTLGPFSPLFDKQNEPSPSLLRLLKLVGMPDLGGSEKTITQINTWAQNNLLRQGERWQEQSDRFETLKPEILPLLQELGFLKESVPHLQNYEGALIHGGFLSRVRIRLDYIVQQWKAGVRFSHLYFLSGQRPLDPEQESEKALMEPENSPLKIREGWEKPNILPKTECEMIQLLWKQAEIPEEMYKAVEVHFINAPMKYDPKTKKFSRPITDDTIVYWLQESPPPGNYLNTSNAPYLPRQDLVIRTLSPKEYVFDTIGPGVSSQEKMAIILDEVARSIFQAKQASQNREKS